MAGAKGKVGTTSTVLDRSETILANESASIFSAPLFHQSFKAVSAAKIADVSFGIWKVGAVPPDSHKGLHGGAARFELLFGKDTGGRLLGFEVFLL